MNHQERIDFWNKELTVAEAARNCALRHLAHLTLHPELIQPMEDNVVQLFPNPTQPAA